MFDCLPKKLENPSGQLLLENSTRRKFQNLARKSIVVDDLWGMQTEAEKQNETTGTRLLVSVCKEEGGRSGEAVMTLPAFTAIKAFAHSSPSSVSGRLEHL